MDPLERSLEHLSFSGGDLDRAEGLRKDEQWLDERLASPDSQLVPLWRNRVPRQVLDRDSGEIFRRKHADAILASASQVVFLGLRKGQALFAADLSQLEQETVEQLLQDQLVPLRQAAPLMESVQAACYGYASQLLHWHRNNRYCGRCGSASLKLQGGHLRRCSAHECGHERFPRTDPAVIMLVEHWPDDGGDPRCLLGHSRRLPRGIYSTLAGFVEPGESLEQAVAREVWEEVGIRVGEMRYRGSQPWPFPASIMLGFRARAETTGITIDRDELDDARWFTANQVSTFGEWEEGGSRERVLLPRADSIARWLILEWLHEVRELNGAC